MIHRRCPPTVNTASLAVRAVNTASLAVRCPARPLAAAHTCPSPSPLPPCAQVALKSFLPPDTEHGYLFTFWGRAAAPKPGVHAAPKVVFQDADDNYTPLKQVSVPLTTEWQMYEVDISLPLYRKGHSVIICFWLGEFQGSYALDDFQVV